MDVVTLQAAQADARKKYGAQGSSLLYKPEGLRRWWAALAAALDTQVGLACIGDSITAGTGADDTGAANPPASSIVTQKSYPAQLRRLFAQQYGDPGLGLIRGGDDRITQGAGVSSSASVGVLGGSRVLDNTETLTYAISGTEINIMWWSNNSAPVTGTFKYNVDGTGDVAVNPGTTADTYGVTTISGLSDAAHTLVITGTSANQAYIAGVWARRLTSGVLVHRAGIPGYTAYQLASKNQTASASRQEGVRRSTSVTLPQKLTIICVGHNDWDQQNNATFGPPTPTSYKAQLLEWITTAVGGGSCVLILNQIPPPAAQVPSGGEVYPISAYWDAARQLANENDHVAHLKLSDLYGTQANAEGLGLMLTGSVHSNSKGYGDIARVLHRILTMPGYRHT